jgi:hypothetical protein
VSLIAHCPYCNASAENVHAEIEHMRAAHPDVIARRLEAIGERFEPTPADQLQGAVDPRVLRDAVLTLKDAAIHDGVTDDVGAAIAALDVLTRGGQ